MAWTQVGTAASTFLFNNTTINVTSTLSVQANDLLVAFVGLSGGAAKTWAVSDGTNSYTLYDTPTPNQSPYSGVAFAIASGSMTNPTFTLTVSASIWAMIRIVQFRPPASTTITQDGTDAMNRLAAITSISVGPVASTGTDVLSLALPFYFSGSSVTGITIAGSSATIVGGTSGTMAVPVGWRSITSPGSHSASATFGSSTDAAITQICFVATSSGSTTVTPNSISAAVSNGTPTLTQDHAITANSISASVQVGTPTLNQNHSLTANSLSATVLNGTPTITVQSGITPNSITSTVQVGTPTLQQNHGLTANSISASVSNGTPALLSGYTLAPNSISASVVNGTPTLVLAGVLQPNSISANVSVGTPSLQQNHILVATSISASVALGRPTIYVAGPSPLSICIGGAWKNGDQYVVVGGAWKTVAGWSLNKDHVWKN